MKKDGVPTRIALPLFMQIFNASDLIVAHNISFDSFLLRSECLKFGCSKEEKEKFCTMRASTDIVRIPPTSRMLAAGFNKFKSPNLQEAYQFFFGEKFDGAHDAFSDVKACMRIFFEIKRREKEIRS
jgi:DNA polymerase-3 subunit epsilon